MKKEYIVTIETKKRSGAFYFATMELRFCELIEARQYNSIIAAPTENPLPLMVYKMNFQYFQ